MYQNFSLTMKTISLDVHTKFCLSILLMVNNLGCFHILSIVNNAALNISIIIWLKPGFQWFGIHASSGIAGSNGNSTLNFLRNCLTVFHNGCTILHSISNGPRFKFLHILANTSVQFSSVHFNRSVVSDSLLPHESQHARPPCPSSTHRVYPNSCLSSWWCHRAISSSGVPFYSCPLSPQHQGLFQWVNSSHEVAKVLEFQFSISPSNEHPGLISFRMDWLDLPAVQRTLKSLLQNHHSKASILWCSAFFIVQLSHPYMITGKTIVLTRWTFVGKVMSLLFTTLSKLVIAFLPRSKHLLISWPQSQSAVILKPKKIVCHCFHYFPIYLPWSDGTGCPTVG